MIEFPETPAVATPCLAVGAAAGAQYAAQIHFLAKILRHQNRLVVIWLEARAVHYQHDQQFDPNSPASVISN
jgi:hypothetical protein